MTDFIIHIITNLAQLERLPIIIATLLGSALIGLTTGGLGGYTRPMIYKLWQMLLGSFIRRLYNHKRSQSVLFIRGMLITFIGLAMAVIVGRFMTYTSAHLPHYALLEVIYLIITISSGALWHMAINTKKNTPSENRQTCNAIVRGFDKHLVAPLVWYFIAGLPLAALHSVISFLYIHSGHDNHNGSYGFSGFFNALERLLGIIPHIIAGLCFTCASLTAPGANPIRILRSIFKRKDKAPYSEGGMPLNTAAYALNITLGGAYTAGDGTKISNVWTGPEGSSAKLTQTQTRRTLFLTITAHVIFLLFVAGIYFYSSL